MTTDDKYWVACWLVLGLCLASIALTTTVTYKGRVIYKGYCVK